ncbi:MAG TPA: ABC transporter permease [Nitrososphaerales archaeon]|nr:ABC transporter permease [Nitrososphaerales archaeon]
MNPGRVLALAKKDWKRTVREPAVLFMIILFPLLLTIAFGASFGAGASQAVSYPVAVVDQGAPGASQWSQQFTQALTTAGVLKVQPYTDNKSAQSALSQGTVQAVIIIPSQFDASIQSFKAYPGNPSRWVNSSLSLYVDSASLVAGQVIPSAVQSVLNTAILGVKPQAIASPVSISNPSLVQVTSTTVFDTFAPGLYSFASIFMIMMVAQSFTMDKESGMLRRISVTPTTTTELMLSEVVSYMVIGFAQVLLIFAASYGLGYHPKAGVEGVSLGFLIAVIFSTCNVGFGLITAAISKNTGAATGLSFLFVLPQMFLGTFVGSALSGAAQSAGRAVPAYYVTDALTSLFTRGAAVTSGTVLLDLFAVIGFSVVILVVGIVFFNRFSRISR